MKRMIISSELDRKMYKVEVTWHPNTTWKASETYDIEASSEKEAIVDALECAKSDLTVEDIYQVDEDEWEALIDFAYQDMETLFHHIGGATENSAYENAINEAASYFSTEILFTYDKE